MKTEEGASFLDWGETNMVSHRPRKRTWTNQTKGDQRRKNLREKGPMNAVQHSPCAESAARGGAQRSLRHHRRLQRSMDLRALLRDKFTEIIHVPLVRRTRLTRNQQVFDSASIANHDKYGAEQHN